MSSKSTNSKEFTINRSGIIYTEEQARFSAQVDAKRMIVSDDDPLKKPLKLSTTVEQYVEDNAFGYFTLVNTWMAVIQDKMPGRASDLTQALHRALCRGISLIDIISDASATADAVIRGDELPANIFSTAYTQGYFAVCNDSHHVSDFARDMMQVLRFPKRFSPLDVDALLADGIRKFADIERRNSRRNVRNYSYSPIVDRATEIVSEIFGKRPLKLDYGAFSSGSCNYTNYVMPISNGTIPVPKTTTSKTRGEKWLAAVGDHSVVPMEYTCTIPYRQGEYVSRVRAVPKSYKSVRMIAMENPTIGYHAYSVREGMERALARSKHAFAINLKDQRQNRSLACRGSADGSLATLDLSSASDSIPFSLCAQLFSRVPQVWAQLVKCRAKYLAGVPGLQYKWKRKEFSMSMWQATPHEVWDPEQKVHKHKSGNPTYNGPTLVPGIPFDQTVNPHLTSGSPSVLVSFPGDFVPTQMMFTSGSQLTPITESITFYSLTRAACEYAALWTGRKVTDWEGLISIYNDDIICPSWAAETVIDALTACGFTVNTDKSFYDDNGSVCFRESCGGDYQGGIDISSIYWPRKELSLKSTDLANTVAILVDLQHRLYYSAPTAAHMVGDIVLGIYPSMTESLPSQGLNDLWSGYAVPARVSAPVAEGHTTAMTREIHLTPSTGWRVSPSLKHILEDERSCGLRQQLDNIRYMIFLKEGPYFENPLDELLGVSTPRPSTRELCAQPCVKWRRDKV